MSSLQQLSVLSLSLYAILLINHKYFMSFSNVLIVFVANYMPDKQHSMLRLSNLLKSIIDDAGLQSETIRPHDRLGKLRYLFPNFEKWLNYLDKYVIFPIELVAHSFIPRKGIKVIYHITDHSNSLYSFFLCHRSKVVTCNDILALKSMLGKYPVNRLRFSGHILQRFILLGLRLSPRIVCISKNTSDELKSLPGFSKHLISFAYLPLNYDFYPMQKDEASLVIASSVCEKKGLPTSNYILHVGGNQWYKNRMGLCIIYAELVRLRTSLDMPPISLILAGKPPSQDLLDFAALNNHLPIFFVTNPSDLEICALYSNSSLLFFPSLQEGFGWPIIEAMSCNCPVVTSRIRPMTEVGGDAAIYIDPTCIYSSASVINDVLQWKSERRSKQIKLGIENVYRFRRDSLANEYLSAYNDVIARPTRI